MDNNIFTESKAKKITPAVEQLYVGAKITGIAVGGLALFFFVLKLLPTAGAEVQNPQIETLTKNKLQIELSLKDALKNLEETKKKEEELTSTISDLREKRDTLTKQIDSVINPSYKPEVEVKK